MKRVENKVVIVTGGASGIGAAATKLLAREGGKILFCDINAEQGRSLESKLLSDSLDVTFVEADVRFPEANEQLVRVAVDKYGKLDAIVCCAGSLLNELIAEYNDDEWIDGIALNCDAGYYLYRYAAPEMVKSGGGSVVFLGDGCMDMPMPGMGCNLVAKMALTYLCRQIGVEQARNNIRANIVSPTLVESPYWDMYPRVLETLKCCANGKHSFRPDDVASIVLFLVSDESRMITVSNLKANDNYDCGFAYDQWAGLQA